jgi:hypothetical protein
MVCTKRWYVAPSCAYPESCYVLCSPRSAVPYDMCIKSEREREIECVRVYSMHAYVTVMSPQR